METNTIRQIPSKLIVNTPGCFIGKTSRQIVVRKDKKKVLEYPSLHLKDIIISGRGISMSSDVTMAFGLVFFVLTVWINGN